MKLFKSKIIYFLHIYKTGGTSVWELLCRNFSVEKILNLYSPTGSSGKIEELIGLYDNLSVPPKTKIVYGHYAYGIHLKFDLPYSYICFVRNPVDRMLSMYYHYQRLDENWQRKIQGAYSDYCDLFGGFDSLESFINCTDLHNQQCMFLTGVSTKEIAKNQEFYAQMAIDNLSKDFSFVGLNEEFETSLFKLKKILKLKTLDFKYRNLGVNKPKDMKISGVNEEIIREKSRADSIIYEHVRKNLFK